MAETKKPRVIPDAQFDNDPPPPDGKHDSRDDWLSEKIKRVQKEQAEKAKPTS